MKSLLSPQSHIATEGSRPEGTFWTWVITGRLGVWGAQGVVCSRSSGISEFRLESWWSHVGKMKFSSQFYKEQNYVRTHTNAKAFMLEMVVLIRALVFLRRNKWISLRLDSLEPWIRQMKSCSNLILNRIHSWLFWSSYNHACLRIRTLGFKNQANSATININWKVQLRF